MDQKIKKHIAVILAVMMAFLFIPVASYAAGADDITYSVDSGDEVEFDSEEFYDVCDDLTGEELEYVEFVDLPAASRGILYYDYDGDDEEEIGEGDEYDADDLDDITFVTDEDFTGETIIEYEGFYDDGDESFDGNIVIAVGSTEEAEDIEYEMDSDETLDFEEDDFNEVCEDATGEELDYVKFTLPASSRGVLYLGYDDGDYDAKVSASRSYYFDDDPAISDITFVPDEDFSGTVSIKYTGWDLDEESFTGYIKIKVNASEVEGDIEYSGEAGEEIDFDEDDFNDYCQDENDEDLNFITFVDLPSSSKGTLYYDYDGRHEEEIEEGDEYYYDDDPSIDDITFVPNRNFSGYVTIEFEGEDVEEDSIEGTIVISVDNEDLVADDIFLNGIAGSAVAMQDVYFSRACEEILDNDLNYVKFTLPSSSYGTLYYDYKASGSSSSSLVSASTKYYYEDKSPYLEKVSFVSAGTGAGTYAIKYTGYDTDGRSFTGQIKITVTAKTAAPGGSSLYFSDVSGSYSWAASYVDTLNSTGVVKGSTGADGKNYYYPASSITRGDFLLLLSRALNLSSSSATGNFSDVPSGSYYYSAIATAKALGIAQGSDNKFYPNATITREDAMVLALRAMTTTGNSPGVGNVSDLYAYSDYGFVSSYAREGVATLIKAGIITGSDGKLNPKSSLTRAESAAIIYRIMY